MQTWQWALTRVRNSFDQELTYTYDTSDTVAKRNRCNGYQANAIIAIYPDEIIYPGGLYRVKFFLENRSDYDQGWEDQQSTMLFSRKMLDSIQILNGATIVRSYDLVYNSGQIFPNVTWRDGVKTPALAQIVEYGIGGPEGNNLPVTTFTYDSMHSPAENVRWVG
jgi:hypothetical protein